MRNTELVIQYMEGQAPETHQYSGVFVTPKNMEIDEAFAESEPPAHDKWEPASLDGDQKKIVGHALRSLTLNMKDFSGIDDKIDPTTENFTPLTELSNKLSNLLPLTDSIGSSHERNGNTNGNGTGRGIRNNPRINILGHKLAYENEEKKLIVSFIPNLSNKSVIIVKANAGICINDGQSLERSSPINSPTPKLLYWITPYEKKLEENNCEIKKNEIGEWKVVFSIPSKVQVNVNIEILQSNA